MVDYNRQKHWVAKKHLDLEYVKLKDVASFIQGLIKEYGENAELREYSDYIDEPDRLYVFVEQEETDEQMKARIAREEFYKKNREENELKEYARLKQKYGD